MNQVAPSAGGVVKGDGASDRKPLSAIDMNTTGRGEKVRW